MMLCLEAELGYLVFKEYFLLLLVLAVRFQIYTGTFHQFAYFLIRTIYSIKSVSYQFHTRSSLVCSFFSLFVNKQKILHMYPGRVARATTPDLGFVKAWKINMVPVITRAL